MCDLSLLCRLCACQAADADSMFLQVAGVSCLAPKSPWVECMPMPCRLTDFIMIVRYLVEFCAHCAMFVSVEAADADSVFLQVAEVSCPAPKPLWLESFPESC